MKTPVLLIAFNRPNYIRQMLQALKQSNIENLLVFRDGPRPLNVKDEVACEEIKNLVENIDWKCSIKTNFMNNNLGCGYGPYSAISWAFQYTDRLIILEDDCIPSTAFFPYCEYLLEKYKDDVRIRHISGFSPISGVRVFEKYDYIFTQYAHTWGWATWKRVWNNMDIQQRQIKEFFKHGGFKGQFFTKAEDAYYNMCYWSRESSFKEATHSWDYQYAVHSKMNGALSIVPAKNLINNIGAEGTHASGYIKHYDTYKDFKIANEPDDIQMDMEYESINFRKESDISRKRYLKMYVKMLLNKNFNKDKI